MKKFRILFIVVAGLFFYSIGLSALVRNVYFSDDRGARWGILGSSVKFMAELPSTMKKVLKEPEFYVKNSEMADGLHIINKSGMDTYPKLLVSFKKEPFGQKFELLDLATGKTLKQWEPDNRELYDLGYNENDPFKPARGSDLYFFHPLMLPDSSLVLNSQLTSLLARVDENNKVIWSKNDRRYHHSIELDHEGMLYICSKPFKSAKHMVLPQDHSEYEDVFRDDEITRVDPRTGEILWTKSVMSILTDNGYEDLPVSKGQVNSDMIHLNDVQPALYDTDYWQKGDLLISCRNICTVFLYRPSTNKILWLEEGPWMNQHDADFLGDSEVVVYGNDMTRDESTINYKLSRSRYFFSSKRKNNEIYVYDFEKDTVTTPYSRLMESEEIRTRTSGRCDILSNGDIFVEDTNSGRIIFGDSISKKAEYVKRIDQEHISSLFWSRIIN